CVCKPDFVPHSEGKLACIPGKIPLAQIGDTCGQDKECHQADRFAYCKLEDDGKRCQCLDDFIVNKTIGSCQPTSACDASQWAENDDQHEARDCPDYQYCTNRVRGRLLDDEDRNKGVCRMITAEIPDN